MANDLGTGRCLYNRTYGVNPMNFDNYHFDVNKEEEREMEKSEFAERYADERIQGSIDEMTTYDLDDALELGEESEVAKTLVDCIKFPKSNSPTVALAVIRGAVYKHLRKYLVTEGECQYDKEHGCG